MLVCADLMLVCSLHIAVHILHSVLPYTLLPYLLQLARMIKFHKAWISHINLFQLGKTSGSIPEDVAIFTAISINPRRYSAFMLLA